VAGNACHAGRARDAQGSKSPRVKEVLLIIETNSLTVIFAGLMFVVAFATLVLKILEMARSK
jgi:hypothetical protein